MITQYTFAKAVSRLSYFDLHEFIMIQELLGQGESLFSPDLRWRFPNIEKVLELKKEFWYEAEKDFVESLNKGIFWTYPGHELYPKQFLNLSEPAWLIRYKGSPVWLSQQGLSVVGSRDPSQMSLQWMDEHLSPVLRHMGIYLVSGGARGVDYKAHLMSLRYQCPTLVLLPSGLSNLYPSSVQDWAEDVVKGGGALISEYENTMPMQKHFFQARNRLIAALGASVLIVEARLRSGTLITARQAIEQGKALMVLPSHPNDIKARGGLNLIFDGAQPVCNAADVAQCLASELLRF